MLIHLIHTACQYVVVTQSYKQIKLLMWRNWHTPMKPILHYKMAPNQGRSKWFGWSGFGQTTISQGKKSILQKTM